MTRTIKYKVTQEYIVDFSNKEQLEEHMKDYKRDVGRKPKTPEDLAEFVVCSFKSMPNMTEGVEELDMRTERLGGKSPTVGSTGWELLIDQGE